MSLTNIINKHFREIYDWQRKWVIGDFKQTSGSSGIYVSLLVNGSSPWRRGKCTEGWVRTQQNYLKRARRADDAWQRGTISAAARDANRQFNTDWWPGTDTLVCSDLEKEMVIFAWETGKAYEFAIRDEDINRQFVDQAENILRDNLRGTADSSDRFELYFQDGDLRPAYQRSDLEEETRMELSLIHI